MRTYSSNEIVDLLNREGFEISKRNFTYYASDKKILPEPITHNNRLRYTDYHIKYLKAILILREKGNKLKEIKESLDKLSEEELELLISTYKPFDSKQMIKEIQQTYQALNKSFNTSGHFTSSIYQTPTEYSSFINNNSLNYFNHLQSSHMTYQETNNNQFKRTKINDNIILETRNIDSDTLKKIIKDFDEILDKYI